jgi:hypothetical protein
LAGCRIATGLCPQFSKLRDYWASHGYPKIHADLEEAYAAIRIDVHAKHWKRVARFQNVLNQFLLFKYRQKNKAAREGTRGGWRIYALFDVETSILYPIIVYPKKEWPDASDAAIIAAIREVLKALNPESSDKS